MPNTAAPIVDFLNRFNAALGLKSPVDVQENEDGIRINLSGEDAELLVRHRGEPLKALQHVVDMSFGRAAGEDTRVFVDALSYRAGKDMELRQMAKFMAEKARGVGPQEMGPLNPYERRIVHMAIAEDPTVSSESIGDAFLKTVIISAK